MMIRNKKCSHVLIAAVGQIRMDSGVKAQYEMQVNSDENQQTLVDDVGERWKSLVNHNQVFEHHRKLPVFVILSCQLL